MYGLRFLVLFFFSVSVLAAPREERVKVSLYYEGLCYWCHSFFDTQLYPTYQALGDAFDVELVPYGFADRTLENGTWFFYCQHGTAECYSNKLQACVINKNYTTAKTLDFVHCLFAGESNESTAEKCANEGTLDWSSIKACTDGVEGDELLAALGDKQDALPQNVKYVPWVLINDVFDDAVYKQARSDLLGLICGLLTNKPSGCDTK